MWTSCAISGGGDPQSECPDIVLTRDVAAGERRASGRRPARTDQLHLTPEGAIAQTRCGSKSPRTPCHCGPMQRVGFRWRSDDEAATSLRYWSGCALVSTREEAHHDS